MDTVELFEYLGGGASTAADRLQASPSEMLVLAHAHDHQDAAQTSRAAAATRAPTPGDRLDALTWKKPRSAGLTVHAPMKPERRPSSRLRVKGQRDDQIPLWARKSSRAWPPGSWMSARFSVDCLRRCRTPVVRRRPPSPRLAIGGLVCPSSNLELCTHTYMYIADCALSSLLTTRQVDYSSTISLLSTARIVCIVCIVCILTLMTYSLFLAPSTSGRVYPPGQKPSVSRAHYLVTGECKNQSCIILIRPHLCRRLSLCSSQKFRQPALR